MASFYTVESMDVATSGALETIKLTAELPLGSRNSVHDNL
jgi:hypothetical protein